jgi:hypothetical protein
MQIIVFGLFLFIYTVAGWSTDGHKIVSRVALGLIKRKTRRFLREHLVTDDHTRFRSAISLASSWADTITDTRPETAHLHFVNVPYRDCSVGRLDVENPCGGFEGPCIVTAIRDFALIASNISASVIERQEAIKFLLHLVADAHQPLHAGFERDRGGTLINLARPEDKSLHEVWDDTLVDMLTEFDGMKWFDVARSLSEERENLERFKLTTVGDDWTETALGILSETVREHTCASAYRNESEGWIGSGDSLSETYLSSRSAITKDQLLKSAARLAQIMDAVASKFVVDERKQQASLLAPKSEGGAVDNRFSALFIDVDEIEEFGFELPEESEDDDDEVAVRIEVLTTLTPTTTGEPVSAEEKRRLAKLKKRQKAKANKRKIDGVDVESLVLIKRQGRYFVTVKDLVVSETFRPAHYLIIYVRFRGMLETEAGIPFLIDVNIFGGQKVRLPTRELIDGIFRHISGTERAQGGAQTTNAPAESVESFKILGGASSGDLLTGALGRIGASMGIDMGASSSDEALLKEIVGQLVGGPIPDIGARMGSLMENLRGSVEPAPFSAIADYVKLIKPSKEALRDRYGGEIPSCARLALDALKAKGDQIVETVSLIPGVRILTTMDALLNSDSGQRRIVFLQESSVSLETLRSGRLWVDLRVIDGSDCVDEAFLHEVVRISNSGRNIRNLREVINKGSRLLDRIFVLFAQRAGFPLQQYASFEEIRTIGETADYIELVLRDSETERRLLQQVGAPPIGRCVAPGTRFFSRKLL